MITKPNIAPAIDNCKVAFYFNKEIGTIELLERQNSEDTN